MIRKQSACTNDFLFCPLCKSAQVQNIDGRHWLCLDCGFDLFHNIASAVGLIILVDTEIIMTVRAQNPQKGLLGFPGGFVDIDETLEQACVRECTEEIGIIPQNFSYFASFPNQYEYKNILYHTSDVFFICRYTQGKDALLSSLTMTDGEVEKCILVNIHTLDESKIAFASGVKAVQLLKKGITT